MTDSPDQSLEYDSSSEIDTTQIHQNWFMAKLQQLEMQSEASIKFTTMAKSNNEYWSEQAAFFWKMALAESTLNQSDGNPNTEPLAPLLTHAVVTINASFIDRLVRLRNKLTHE